MQNLPPGPLALSKIVIDDDDDDDNNVDDLVKYRDINDPVIPLPTIKILIFLAVLSLFRSFPERISRFYR